MGDWIRRHRGVAMAIAGIVALVVGFALLAVAVLSGRTRGFDQAVLGALRDGAGVPVGPSWLPKAVQDWSALGSSHIVVPVVVVVTIALVLAKRPRTAIMLIACLVGTAVIVNGLKLLFARARPDAVSHIDIVTGFSFPSGHTTTATAFYATVGFIVASAIQDRAVRRFVYLMAALIPLAVGFTRVYLGVHYPTDVFGGWMVGLAWALCLGLSNQLLQRRGVVEDARGDLSQDDPPSPPVAGASDLAPPG